MKINTSQFRYSGEDRLDITVKSGVKTFAPTWDMVMGIKNGSLSKEEYTNKYIALMNQSYKNNKKIWEELLAKDHITFVCYCKQGDFCHRILLAKMLESSCALKPFHIQYEGEVDSKGNLIIGDGDL